MPPIQVEFNPLPEEAVLETLREFGAISELSVLLSQMLMFYKAMWLDGLQRDERIRTTANPAQVQATLALLKPILDAYQSELEAKGEIDFEDMIGRALRDVASGRFKPMWRFILVDEFQDISEPRARLLKALKDKGPDCSLFCVGDDWQSIYRFAGSDISVMTGFADYFGPSRMTLLDKAFRFNNSICEVSSRFVTQNPAQIKKALVTVKQVANPAVSLLRQGKHEGGESELHRVLYRIQEIAKPGASVYLLGRYHFTLPDGPSLAALKGGYRNLAIEAMTMHASKGKEADYVVVLGLECGANGGSLRKRSPIRCWKPCCRAPRVSRTRKNAACFTWP